MKKYPRVAVISGVFQIFRAEFHFTGAETWRITSALNQSFDVTIDPDPL